MILAREGFQDLTFTWHPCADQVPASPHTHSLTVDTTTSSTLSRPSLHFTFYTLPYLLILHTHPHVPSLTIHLHPPQPSPSATSPPNQPHSTNKMSTSTSVSLPSPSPIPPHSDPSPSAFRYTLSFLLVGLAWGLTTPFIRRAALDFHPPPHASLTRLQAREPSLRTHSSISEKLRWGSWWGKVKVVSSMWTVVDLLRSPRYAVPLVVNLTGSVWFFLLVGRAGMFCLHSIT